MNIKYKQLSVIGKIWSLSEMFHAGVLDNKQSYIEATARKLDELLLNDENKISLVFNESSLKNITTLVNKTFHFQAISEEEQQFLYDGSISSIIWNNAGHLFSMKKLIKTGTISDVIVKKIDKIYYEVRNLWVKDLKEKKLSSIERRDLFKIKEEIEDLKIKIENRIKRNQINLI